MTKLIESIDRKIARYDVMSSESILESNAQHWQGEKRPWRALRVAVEALEGIANADYRGNPPPAAGDARKALAEIAKIVGVE